MKHLVTKWLSDNPGLVRILAIGVGILAGAIIALNVAIWASSTAFRGQTAAVWASTTALLANPITWN